MDPENLILSKRMTLSDQHCLTKCMYFVIIFWYTLLHKIRKLSHLWVGVEVGLAFKAVTLHWPVLPGFWRSVALAEIPIGTCTVGTLTASTG